MNKKEKLMLVEIYQYLDSVPEVNNPMSTKDCTRHRVDSLQLKEFIKELTYCLLMYSTPDENKKEWEEKFNETLKELKEFIKIRTDEQWDWETKYRYTKPFI